MPNLDTFYVKSPDGRVFCLENTCATDTEYKALEITEEDFDLPGDPFDSDDGVNLQAPLQ